MKKVLALLFISAYLLSSCRENGSAGENSIITRCNPIDISYRFCSDEPSRREAADPTVIRFRGDYILFASKSGGYWFSSDLADWTFVETSEIPVEEYAPTVIAIDDTLYFLASSRELSTIYKSGDPKKGKWSVAREELEIPVWDPAFFMDEDQRLYMYWGCSDEDPLYGVELDYRNNFSFIGDPVELLRADTERYGWEVPGDYNTYTMQAPWIEGSWMNKHDGKYYLQFAGPGTEYKSYADGVAVSDAPLGPFTYQKQNPFAAKPEGYIAGAGHGSTFSDEYGNYWHMATVTISVKHIFERRLALYPAFFDEDGVLHADTRFGDYPYIIPERRIKSPDDIFPGWMLLSYGKPVTVSSSVDTLVPQNMTDEDIRTYWSAASGAAGEYAMIDLESIQEVHALQLNFAEQGTEIYGRKKGLRQCFIVEYSSDGKEWSVLSDQSDKTDDRTHVYLPLKEKISCRYLKVTNVEVPGGNFALSAFRVFGKGKGVAPGEVENIKAARDNGDRRMVHLSWEKSEGAQGYVVRYGNDKEKLYLSYQVYRDTVLNIRSLDAQETYYFRVDAFNENGVNPGETTVTSK